MDREERFNDLEKRSHSFFVLELPGQPIGMHMGTSYLVTDLLEELRKERSNGSN